MTTDDYVALIRDSDPHAEVTVMDNGWVQVVVGSRMTIIDPASVVIDDVW